MDAAITEKHPASFFARGYPPYARAQGVDFMAITGYVADLNGSIEGGACAIQLFSDQGAAEMSLNGYSGAPVILKNEGAAIGIVRWNPTRDDNADMPLGGTFYACPIGLALSYGKELGILESPAALPSTHLAPERDLTSNRSIILSFTTAFEPDPVDVLLSIQQSNEHSRDLRIKWPEESNGLFRTASELLEQIAFRHSSASRFYGMLPNEIAEFVRKIGISNSQNKQKEERRLIQKRLPFTIQSAVQARGGIRAEQVVTNYLKLANLHIHRQIAQALGLSDVLKQFVPSEWDEYSSLATERDAVAKGFGITPEFKNISYYGGQYWDMEFWGPKRLPGHLMVGPDFFDTYLIPQTEMILALRDCDDILQYDLEPFLW